MFGKRLLLAFCRAACSLRASAIAADGEAEDFGPGVRDLKSLLKLIDGVRWSRLRFFLGESGIIGVRDRVVELL